MRKLLLLTLFLPLLLPANEEAERFFAEYRILSDRAEKQRKLAAALALDPMNEYYRYEELLFFTAECYNYNWDTWIARIKAQFARAKKFHADFPNYRSGDWNRMLVFDVIRIFQRQPFQMVYSGHGNSPTAKQAAEIAAICDELRPLIRMDKKRNFYPCDPSDGITSVVEMNNDINIVYRTHMKEYYGNWARFLSERLAAYSGLLQRMELFVKQHPESKAQVEKIGGFEWFEDMALGDGLKVDDAATLRYFQTDIVPMLKDMEQSSFAEVRGIAVRLRLCHHLVNAPRTVNAALQTTEDFLRNKKDLNSVDAAWTDSRFINSFSNWWIRSSAIDSRLEKYRNSFAPRSLEDIVTELSRKSDWRGLLAVTGELRTAQQKWLATLRMNHPYQNLASRFAAGKPLPDNAWDFFRRMNADFVIRTQTLAELFDTRDQLQAVGAIRRADSILSVLTDGKKLSLGNWDLTRKTVKQYRLSVTPWKFDGLYSKNLGVKNLAPWDADGHYAALALQNGDLLLYDFAAKCEKILADRLPAPARGVAISGKRIFVLCGIRGTSRKNFLISCDFAGGDYRVHFSNLRSEKQHEIENSTGELNSLIAFGEGKLYFLLSDRTVKLYCFHIAENRFEIICDLGNPAFDNRLYLSDNVLYTQTDGHGFRIRRIDPERKKAIPVLTQNIKDKTPGVPFCRSWMVQGPFVRHGDLLFGGGLWATTVVDLKNPANSPQLFMPPSGFLLAGLNGEVIYFCHNRYFALSARRNP